MLNTRQWNQFNTIVQRQRVRLVHALEILAGRRPRTAAQTTNPRDAPVTPKRPSI